MLTGRGSVVAMTKDRENEEARACGAGTQVEGEEYEEDEKFMVFPVLILSWVFWAER